MPIQIHHSEQSIYGTEKVSVNNGKSIGRQTLLICGDGAIHISDAKKDSRSYVSHEFAKQLQEFLLSLEGPIEDENDNQYKRGFETALNMALTSVKSLKGKVDQESQIGVDFAIEQLEDFKLISQRTFSPSEADESDLLEAEKA